MRPACHMSTIAFVRRAFSCGSAVHSTLSAAVTMSSPCTGSKIALSIPLRERHRRVGSDGVCGSQAAAAAAAAAAVPGPLAGICGRYSSLQRPSIQLSIAALQVAPQRATTADELPVSCPFTDLRVYRRFATTAKAQINHTAGNASRFAPLPCCAAAWSGGWVPTSCHQALTAILPTSAGSHFPLVTMLAATRAASSLAASTSGLAQELARATSVLARHYHKNVSSRPQGPPRVVALGPFGHAGVQSAQPHAASPALEKSSLRPCAPPGAAGPMLPAACRCCRHCRRPRPPYATRCTRLCLPQVVDHYEKPRNVGSFDKADPNVGTGLVGAPACGDVMKLQVCADLFSQGGHQCFAGVLCGATSECSRARPAALRQPGHCALAAAHLLPAR